MDPTIPKTFSAADILLNRHILDDFGTREKVLIFCDGCQKPVQKIKHHIEIALFHDGQKRLFCTVQCYGRTNVVKVSIPCGQCGKQIEKFPRELQKSKSGKGFCSRSCGTKYSNANKKHGTTRSKLEVFIESKIKSDFPDLPTLYNDKTTIGLELDFIFPSIKLAVEINGIFHFEPIHGVERLERVQNRDKSKYALCRNLNHELIVIPTTKSRYTAKDQETVWNGIKEILEDRIKFHKSIEMT
jgi:hypothetical protein